MKPSQKIKRKIQNTLTLSVEVNRLQQPQANFYCTTCPFLDLCKRNISTLSNTKKYKSDWSSQIVHNLKFLEQRANESQTQDKKLGWRKILFFLISDSTCIYLNSSRLKCIHLLFVHIRFYVCICTYLLSSYYYRLLICTSRPTSQ